MLCPANMLGYLSAIRPACTGGHVECGSLFTLSLEGLPPSADRACPGVLLASTGERQLVPLSRGISRLAPLSLQL
jgi:hypothetical protein